MKKGLMFFSFLAFLVLCSTVLVSSCSTTKLVSLTSDKGVVINGVKWATRNVDAIGTFASKPEDSGMLYKWNRKKAWAITGNIADWDSTYTKGTEWEKVNDPSPVGWRVPTSDEIETLLDTDKVSNEWTTENGVYGRKFTDKATGNTLFLPAAGTRYGDTGACSTNVGTDGYYLSSDANFFNNPNSIIINSKGIYRDTMSGRGQSIRAVAEKYGKTYDFAGCNSEGQKLILRKNGTCTVIDKQVYDGTYIVRINSNDIWIKFNPSNHTLGVIYISTGVMTIKIGGEDFIHGACK